MKPPQRKISYTYRDRRDPDNGLNRTHISAISHDEDGQNATVLGDIQVDHPIDHSRWHSYSGTREHNEAWDAPKQSGMIADEVDQYRWDAPYQQGWKSEQHRNVRYNTDRPMFVDGNPEGAAGRDSTLSYMRVAKEGRHIVPTMLGLAQFQTAMSRGNTLIPDKSLSDHSSRMVGRLESAGITQRDPETSPNDLTLSRGLKYGDKSKAMHMHETTTDFDPDTVTKGRRLGRQAVRDSSHLREDPKTPSPLNQMKLPGIE
jgi:hypothetical protein